MTDTRPTKTTPSRSNGSTPKADSTKARTTSRKAVAASKSTAKVAAKPTTKPKAGTASTKAPAARKRTGAAGPSIVETTAPKDDVRSRLQSAAAQVAARPPSPARVVPIYQAPPPPPPPSILTSPLPQTTPPPPAPTPPPQAQPQWIPQAGPSAVAPHSGKRRSRKGLVAGAVVGALVLAGGGAGALLITRDTAPSKAEFILSADTVCRPANAPVSAIVKPTNYPELATAAGAVVGATTGQLSQLRALERPTGAEGESALAFLRAFEVAGQGAKALQDGAAKSDDVATIAASRTLRTSFDDSATQAGAYGLGACASGMKSGVDTLLGGSQSVIKSAFVVKAENLCRAGARDADKIPEPRADTGAELARYLGQLSGIFDKLLADIKGLPVPPGDETAVAEMLSAQERTNVKFHEVADAAGDEATSRFLAADRELTTLTTAADAKLDAYGLGTCGSNFGDS